MPFVGFHVIVHRILILLRFLTDRTDEESFGIFFVRVGHLVEESSGNLFKFSKLRVMAFTTSSNNVNYALLRNNPPA